MRFGVGRGGIQLLCAGALVLAGCSGDDSASADSGDSGMSGGGGQTTSGDASNGQSDAGTPTSSGQVVLYAPPLLDYSSYGATFTNPAHPQPDLGCTSTAYGMCNVSNCPYPQPTEAARPHAGTITFDSPAIMAMGTITPDMNGLYPSAMSMGLHFAGNEMVTFVGQGDSVPAFNETVAYPELLLMSAPQMPGTTPVMVPRTRDLTLRWTGGEADVSLRLNALKIVGTTIRTLDCTAPSSPGMFTVPRAALQAIGTSADLTVDTVRRHTFQAGDYAVEILIGGNALTPDKMRAISIQLQ